MKLAPLTENDVEAMIDYLGRYNLVDEHHIGFFGDSNAEIRESLAEIA